MLLLVRLNVAHVREYAAAVLVVEVQQQEIPKRVEQYVVVLLQNENVIALDERAFPLRYQFLHLNVPFVIVVLFRHLF